MTEVFISYRSADSGGWPSHLDYLIAHTYGRDRAFRATGSLKAGEAFPGRIRRALSDAAVVLAVIGPHWLGETEGGRRRIDDETDWVRTEIRLAFEGGTPVIPVLVDGATRLVERDLPADIRELATRHDVRLNSRSTPQDRDLLLARLEEYCPSLRDTRTTPPELRPPGRRMPRRFRPARRVAASVVVGATATAIIVAVATFAGSVGIHESGPDSPASSQETTGSPLPAVSGASSLRPGRRLGPGQSLASPDGRFALTMQDGGNLVLLDGRGIARWDSATSTPGSSAVLQADGNLVVQDPDGRDAWQSGSDGTGGQRLDLQDDGDLVLRTGDEIIAWRTRTGSGQGTAALYVGEGLESGEYLESANAAHRLTMQTDGVLALHTGENEGWRAQGNGVPGATLSLQRDGNLVVHDPDGRPEWASLTYDKGGHRLSLQDDGMVVLFSHDDEILWQVPPSGSAGT